MKNIEPTKIDKHIEDVTTIPIKNRVDEEPPIFLRRNLRLAPFQTWSSWCQPKTT
jgi:hypothetical protein